MKPVEGEFDPKESLDWKADISMSARFFRVSFKKMCDMIHLINELDTYLVAEAKMDHSEAGVKKGLAASSRIEARQRLIEMRMSFELGHDLPLIGVQEIPHKEWAKDLYAKGAISQARMQRVLDGLPSEDLPDVIATIERMRAERPLGSS